MDEISVDVDRTRLSFSRPLSTGLPLVEANAGSETWTASRDSFYLLRWGMIDSRTHRHVVKGSAWKGRVRDDANLREIVALITIWAAYLNLLFGYVQGMDVTTASSLGQP